MFDRRIVVHQVVPEQRIVKGHQILLLLCMLGSRIGTTAAFLFNNHGAMDVLTWLLIEVLFHFNRGIVLLGGFFAYTPFSLFGSDKVIFLHDATCHVGWNPRILGVSFIFDHCHSGVLALSEILLSFIHTLNEVFGAITYSTSGNWTTVSHQTKLLLLVCKFRPKPRKTLLPAQLALWTP